MAIWIFVFVVNLFQIELTKCAIKTWTANTNYDNANNWDTKRVPCERDRVIFPADENVAVFMPKSAVVRELVLPNNGLLVFPDDGSLVLTEETETSSCSGEDVTFIGGKSSSWYDPDNWNISSPFAVNLAEDNGNLPVPHSEQIPCAQDDAFFPSGTTFRVHFDSTPLQVKTLTINEKMFNSDELRTLFETETGKALFVNPPQISVGVQNCNDRSGCACGNDQPQILSKICSNAGPNCPEKLECSDPIEVIGHCCSLCGSSLVMEYNDKFAFDTFKQLYLNYFHKPEFRNVQGYLSKTQDNKIQIVFSDAGNSKGQANRLARDVNGYLKQDIAELKMYGLKSIKLQSTTHWYSMPSQSSLTQKGATVGWSIGVILILVIGALVFYFLYKRHSVTGFAFARFDSGGRIEMELGTTPHEMLEPTSIPVGSEALPSSAEPGKGFDNPMYEKPGLSLENPSYTEGSEKIGKKQTTDYHENPVFMVLDDKDY